MTMPSNRYLPAEIIEKVRMESLLEYRSLIGVDINARDERKKNALYWAIKNCNAHNAQILMEHGIDLEVSPGQHALFYAIKNNCYELIVLLVENNVDVNRMDRRGRSPLMLAVEKEQFKTVCFLLRNNADLLYCDAKGSTVEDYIQKCKSPEIKDFISHVLLLENTNI